MVFKAYLIKCWIKIWSRAGPDVDSKGKANLDQDLEPRRSRCGFKRKKQIWIRIWEQTECGYGSETLAFSNITMAKTNKSSTNLKFFHRSHSSFWLIFKHTNTMKRRESLRYFSLKRRRSILYICTTAIPVSFCTISLGCQCM